MGWFGKLFGTEKAIVKGLDSIDKTVGHVASGLDMMFHTDEEKAQEHIKITGMRMDMVKSLHDQFEPRAISRRIFAGVILGNFFLHANMWVWFAWKQSEHMVATLKELLALELQLTLLVGFFYFGYYGVKSILKK